MHISGLPHDLYSFLQFLFTAFGIAFALLQLVKNTAWKYFVVEDTFDEGNEDRRRKVREDMLSVTSSGGDICASCGNSASKRCTGCKAVRYCSHTCQSKHWRGGHKLQCNEFKIGNLRSIVPSSSCGSDSSSVLQRPKKVLFPYEEFVKLFTWDKSGFPPCGLLNCGNSCFANVVLQCLSCTRPLVAYLLETGHRRECRRNDWCFLCELQTHVERARLSSHPFSPINILSRLPNIGGNLGYGKQEDAHEFMRFAIDTMQSVCLDEFGGEKALHPVSLETTLIQYIFGGQLQSQVTCTECNRISNRCESMMDLTVEIQGDAASLEDCLDQFTVKEWLDGENMYKCEGCNDYVKAWKRLTVCQAPNVLTITLKRFQSGRFGKLNKRVTFPETLDLGPYMSDDGDGTDLYRLYAVVVHVDMLNASYFGHYICYTKDFCGNWYRIDDCKVSIVELEEVLAQGAYMLLYSRTCVRPHCVKPLIPSMEEQPMLNMAIEAPKFSQKPCESIAVTRSINSVVTPRAVSSDLSQHVEESNPKEDPVDMDPNDSPREDPGDMDLGDPPREDPGDMDLGDPPREDPVDMDLGDPPREDLQDIGIRTECSNAAEYAAEIGSSEEPVHSNEPNSSTSSKEPQAIGPHNFEVQVPGTDYDVECNFKEVNEETVDSDSELQLSKVAVNGYLTGQNDSHEVAKTSSSLLVAIPNPTTKTVHEVNPGLEQVVRIKSGNGFLAAQNTEIKPLKSAGKNSCSRTKSKPLFSLGFLDKGTKNRSINSNGKAHMRIGEVCPLPKENGFCNGFAAKPGFLHENGNSEVNNHDGAHDSVLTSSFAEEQCLKKKSKSENCNGGEGFHVVENASSRVNLVQRVIPSSASCEKASSSTEAS